MFSVSNIIFATTFCNRACVGFLAFIRNYESPLYAHITLVSNTLVSNTRLRKQASVRVACDDWIIIFFVGVCFWCTFAWRQMSWRGVTNLMISIICLCTDFRFRYNHWVARKQIVVIQNYSWCVKDITQQSQRQTCQTLPHGCRRRSQSKTTYLDIVFVFLRVFGG